MKQRPLTEKERCLLADYRMQRAKDTLAEADKLIEGKFYNAAVNRLYYACYYSVVALLIKNNVTAHTHNGVKQLFSLHFIANSKMDKELAIFYGRLFNDRMSGDYDDFVIYDSKMITELRPKAKNFITAIAKEMMK